MFSRTHLMEWLRHTSISHDRHYGPGTKCTLDFFWPVNSLKAKPEQDKERLEMAVERCPDLGYLKRMFL